MSIEFYIQNQYVEIFYNMVKIHISGNSETVNVLEEDLKF